MKRPKQNASNLPEKANKILACLVVVFLLITLKVWHLAIVQHEKKQEEAWKPQKRVVVEKSDRAMICDRFGKPLAVNKVQYNAALSYALIRELPRSIWQRDERGKRVKKPFRKEYITRLSSLLGEQLQMDPEKIEDLIHSKAAIFGNVPCVLKEGISESTYFRLKMLEKDWPGICAEVVPKRFYPQGPVAAEVIGYLGPISRAEYHAVVDEMRSLRNTIAEAENGEVVSEDFGSIEQMKTRLEELERRAYHINDLVGKVGVEASFDEELRGLSGKHLYLADTHGNLLSELPGGKPVVEGKRLMLTLSSELQAYAEQLLADYDSAAPSGHPAASQKRLLMPEQQPWIKGGAIVVMDPKTGEVYALASYPRFDPNDFIRGGDSELFQEKNQKVRRWLETEGYIAAVWDQKVPYSRERYNSYTHAFYDQSLPFSWNTYLSFILPSQSPVRAKIESENTLHEALFIQAKVDELLALFHREELPLSPAKIFDYLFCEEEIPIGLTLTIPEKVFLVERCSFYRREIEQLREQLAPYFASLPLNYEKLLLVDLYRLGLDAKRFSPDLTQAVGAMTLGEYHNASAHFISVFEATREIVFEAFQENEFKTWREAHFKEYLAGKRKEEREAKKKYARPFIEYLDEVKQTLFSAFWETYKWELLSAFLGQGGQEVSSSTNAYTRHLINWARELEEGAHMGLDWTPHYHALRRILQPIAQNHHRPFLQTLRGFYELDRPLYGKYTGLRGAKEKDLAAAFYPTYGFGFARSHAFRQATTIGSIFKLVPAYEALKQNYLALKERKESLYDLNPLVMIDNKHRTYGKKGGWNVGLTREGKVIPMHYKGGRLPRSEHAGVGKVDLPRALEVSSNPYFALLAGDFFEDPEDLCHAAHLLGFGEKTGIDLPGEYAGRLPQDVAYNRTGLYAMSIGQHTLVGTPLQTATMLAAIANGGALLKPQITLALDKPIRGPEVRWQVFLPREVQALLIQGMKQVVSGEKGTARFLKQQFDAKLVSQIVGKTSTSEVIRQVSLDGSSSHLKLKDVWFGGISYTSEDLADPELVVVVYLKDGEWGRHAAPLAAEMVKKWREIQNRASNWH